MSLKFLLYCLLSIVLFPACQLMGSIKNLEGKTNFPETLSILAQQFTAPPDAYKPHAWWH